MSGSGFSAAEASAAAAPALVLRVRLFAAAKAAFGLAELTLTLPVEATIADALAALPRPTDLEAAARAESVLLRCSYLLDARATTDAGTPVAAAALLDVLPPFAGG